MEKQISRCMHISYLLYERPGGETVYTTVTHTAITEAFQRKIDKLRLDCRMWRGTAGVGILRLEKKKLLRKEG